MTTAVTSTDATEVTTEGDPDTTASWEADDDAEAEATAEAGEDAEAKDDTEGGKKRGVRQRLADAESERGELREALATAHEQLFNIAAERAGVKPELMVARGITAADFGTGMYGDLDQLTAAMVDQRNELGLPHKPQPNPVAGRTTGDGGGPSTSFADVLRQHAQKAG